MIIKYGQLGADRKAFAKAVGELLGAAPEYLGAPTMAYKIADCIVTRGGDLELPDDADSASLVERLSERGFRAISAVGADGGETIPEETKAPQNANFGLTVELPKERVNVDNINNLISAKGELIKKALGVSGLPVEVGELTVKFPWFDRELTAGETEAYTRFIGAVCGLSLKSKRISPKSKPAENEKYAFRCFLLRLGFIGKEFKASRKILLERLEGSSAFKGGAKIGQSSES
ncbi:MAG: virulence protein [Lachnospiraceae bacterium]|nr:virulence protein [Lachnospiraceae bacterium]